MSITYEQIIRMVDRRMPNAYDDEDKRRWLHDLDMQIWREVIQTHLNPDGYSEPDEDGSVLVPEQFAEDIYAAYLQACIAWNNEEDARYDRYITRFNDGYERFARWYNETHKPIPARECWRF